MIGTLRLSLGLSFAAAIVLAAGTAPAQQAPQATTPGVALGTTGTTFGTPGATQLPSTPGGGIPQGAATQNQSLLPRGVQNYNNSSAGAGGTSVSGLPTAQTTGR